MYLNLFTPKILLLPLRTDNHTVLMIVSLEYLFLDPPCNNPLVDIFLYSHFLSTWYCIDHHATYLYVLSSGDKGDYKDYNYSVGWGSSTGASRKNFPLYLLSNLKISTASVTSLQVLFRIQDISHKRLFAQVF